MMDEKFIDCTNCSAKNRIYPSLDTESFQCFNCNAFEWLDDQSRIEYQVFYNLGYEEGERALRSGLTNFVIGEYGYV